MVKSNVGKAPPAASTIMNDDEFENFFQLLDARRVNFREGPRPDVVYPASPAREATRPQMEWGSGGGGNPVPSPARQHKVHHRAAPAAAAPRRLRPLQSLQDKPSALACAAPDALPARPPDCAPPREEGLRRVPRLVLSAPRPMPPRLHPSAHCSASHWRVSLLPPFFSPRVCLRPRATLSQVWRPWYQEEGVPPARLPQAARPRTQLGGRGRGRAVARLHIHGAAGRHRASHCQHQRRAVRAAQ